MAGEDRGWALLRDPGRQAGWQASEAKRSHGGRERSGTQAAKARCDARFRAEAAVCPSVAQSISQSVSQPASLSSDTLDWTDRDALGLHIACWLAGCTGAKWLELVGHWTSFVWTMCFYHTGFFFLSRLCVSSVAGLGRCGLLTSSTSDQWGDW